MKVRVSGTKMADANVEYISLVDRGANKIPFRVIKKEGGMGLYAGIDLSSIFVSKADKGSKGVQILGVVTMKGAGLESIKKQVKDAGFNVDNMVEHEDGSVVFSQSDEGGDGTILKMSKDVALIVKGFEPYSLTQDNSTFAEIVKAKGFYSGIYSTLGVLTDAVSEAVSKSANKEDINSAVTKLFGEAQAYLQTVVSALPEKAFKLEAVKSEEVDDTETEQEADAGAQDGETSTGEATGTDEKTDAEVTDEATVTTETTTETTAEEPAPKVEDVVAKAMEGVQAAITNMAAQFKTDLAGVNKSVSELNGRIDTVEAVAKTAQDAVKGTVIITSHDDQQTTVAKKHRSGMGEIDTAFMPNVRKRNKG